MSFFSEWFGKAPLQSTILQEHERHAFENARNMVLDELETAVCDANGKRFKEREVRAAMKTVSRL